MYIVETTELERHKMHNGRVAPCDLCGESIADSEFCVPLVGDFEHETVVAQLCASCSFQQLAEGATDTEIAVNAMSVAVGEIRDTIQAMEKKLVVLQAERVTIQE